MPRSLFPPVVALAAFVFVAATSFDQQKVAGAAFEAVNQKLFSRPGALANAWADFDGDGDPDLAVSMKSGAVLLFRNDSEGFMEVGAEIGLPVSGDELRGLSWGDFDGDGDPDLYAGSNVSPIPSRSYLFRNDGGQFVEVAEAVGAPLPGRFSRQANWVDFDGDGDLDLYAANRAGANRLLRNDGFQDRLGFEALPYGFGAADIRRTVGACWFDADGDGDLDLFLANQSGDSDAFWRNDGERFIDVASELGVDQTQRTLGEGGVGCAPGDYDNDGDLDLFVGTYGINHLYQNTLTEGRFGFRDVAEEAGLLDPHSVVGAAWGDADNDGDLDLFLASYARDTEGVQQPANYLMINNGDKTFVNALSPNAPLNAADHGVVWVDFDGDGDLDLSLTDGYGPEGGAPVFRNGLGVDRRSLSLAVRITDGQGIANQAGAKVFLLDQESGVLGVRMVSTGGGYNAQSDLPVFIVVPEHCAGCQLKIEFVGATPSLSIPLPQGGASRLEVRGASFTFLP